MILTLCFFKLQYNHPGTTSRIIVKVPSDTDYSTVILCVLTALYISWPSTPVFFFLVLIYL